MSDHERGAVGLDSTSGSQLVSSHVILPGSTPWPRQLAAMRLTTYPCLPRASWPDQQRTIPLASAHRTSQHIRQRMKRLIRLLGLERHRPTARHIPRAREYRHRVL
jgi:hypothetical protein